MDGRQQYHVQGLRRSLLAVSIVSTSSHDKASGSVRANLWKILSNFLGTKLKSRETKVV
jgi:hypothetical protein